MSGITNPNNLRVANLRVARRNSMPANTLIGSIGFRIVV
jgi:hypothetical protein